MKLALVRTLLAAVLSLGLTTSAWAGLDEVLADALAEFWEDVVLVERNAIAEAQFILGTFYYDEQGVVPQDYVEAFKWFRKAAELEPVDAQFILGVMYFAGQGVPVDTVEAFKWVRMAAEQGNVDAQFTPGQPGRITLGENANTIAIDDHVVAIDVDCARKAPVRGVATC